MSAVPLALPRRLPQALPGVVLAVLLGAGAIAAVGPRPALIALLWLAAVTPGLTAVDITEHRLPDRMVLPGYPVALSAVAAGAASGGTPMVTAAVLGAVYGLVLVVLHVAGGMGLGDVKLAPVLGLSAAAVSPATAIAAPLLAFLCGGAVAVVALVRTGPGTRIPFGPAMLLGAWSAVLLT